MAKITWNNPGKKFFELGVDRGVLYVQDKSGAYKKGVAWEGLTSVKISPEGGETNKHYADNQVYASITSSEEVKGTVEAFWSPAEFDACDGAAYITPGVSVGQQRRAKFALCYRTKVGSDSAGTDAGYKLHILYGCSAAPSEMAATTINDNAEPTTLSWGFSAQKIAVDIPGFEPTGTVTINSLTVDSALLKKIEDKLYGTESLEPTLITPAEISALVSS